MSVRVETQRRGAYLQTAGSAQADSRDPVSPEQWRPVVGYERTYQVSSLGRVRRSAAGAGATLWGILKHRASRGGYATVSLSGGARGTRLKVEVHSLVARAFLGPLPDGCQVDHRNRDRSDPSLSNLRYLKREANQGRMLCAQCGGEGHGRCGKGNRQCGRCGAVGHNKQACLSGRAARVTRGLLDLAAQFEVSGQADLALAAQFAAGRVTT